MLYSALRLGPLFLELTPSSFRKTAIGLTAAAAMFAGTASYSPAYSAEPNPLVAACDKIKDADRRAGCLVEAIEKNTKLLKAQGDAADKHGAAADQRAAAADEVIGCLTDLKKFKERNPEGFAKLGTITRETACSAAAKIPRPTASLN
ncbi:MAG: hypothetical protein A4S14_14645 [Proteobacteria bacterium SG_bin9]|nr:MAG: hypothetical protein A4S14_14645 [Proteobacteria bacterium SG_bin9]